MIAHFNDDRDWFFDKRFGLFIHWGIYALDGWHEQIQWRKGIPKAQYVERAGRFNPVGSDPDAWLDLAAEAGIVVTAYADRPRGTMRTGPDGSGHFTRVTLRPDVTA